MAAQPGGLADDREGDAILSLANGTNVVSDLERTKQQAEPLSKRVGRIQERVAAFSSTGAFADKPFFDELSGDL